MSKSLFTLLTEDNAPDKITSLLEQQKGDLFILNKHPNNPKTIEKQLIKWCKENMDEGKLRTAVAKIFINPSFSKLIEPYTTKWPKAYICSDGDDYLMGNVYKFTTGYGILIFFEIPE